MIGEKIREIRQSQGRSLAEIAVQANISVATLSRIETDKQAIDVDLLLGLVQILGVQAADVLGQANNGDPLAHRIASLGAKQRTDLWRDVAAERRTQRSRKTAAGNFAQQIEELLAQLDFVREELEALRAKARKSRWPSSRSLQTAPSFALISGMFGRKKKPADDDTGDGTGTVDGGEGRGVPLGGHDDRPPTGYRPDDEDFDLEDRDFLWEEGDPADRRKDPLRKP